MEKTKQALLLRLKENEQKTEAALHTWMARQDADLQEIFDAQSYSLLGGGKRIRPFLVNEFCRVLGGREQVSMPFACALEMIHTYSLIHDDLPCMDDDDLRRGKLTCHKKFGYATALLAGDALLTKAFWVAAENADADDRTKVNAVRLMGALAGESGMIGGQIMDLRGEKQPLSRDQLIRLYGMKTGNLMECAALLGVISAGYDVTDAKANDARTYAKEIGIAFQVMDDILDVEGDPEELGKKVGADASRHKTTFLTYSDLKEAKAYAAHLTEHAISAIADWQDNRFLIDLAEYLLTRRY